MSSAAAGSPQGVMRDPNSKPSSSRRDEAPARATAPYAVGIVNYHTYSDLEQCMESVNAQSLAPCVSLIIDADSEPQQLDRIRKTFPTSVCEPHPNLGFAAAANIVLERLATLAPEAEFVLLLTPDVELTPDFAAQLTSEMAARPEVALASGKLMRPDGGGRQVIDSAGIRLPAHRRPRDRGSEQIDRGQYDEAEFVFGVSGAALMLRREALEDLAIEGEVFDEDFFIYYEDTDLCWRANLLGWSVLYSPSARAVHRRSWRRGRRFEIGEGARRHSFKNQYLAMIKNERARDFWKNLPVIAVWEVLRLGHAVLRDRSVLRGYRDAWQLSGRAWHKRAILQERMRRGATHPTGP